MGSVFATNLVFEECIVFTSRNKVSHFCWTIQTTNIVFDTRAEHKMVVVFIPSFNQSKVMLSWAIENKFGRFGNRSRMIML